MRLISFAFKDLDTGWTLDRMEFGALNLLLGVSGVGKSRILRALRMVRDLVLGASPHHPLTRCAWTLEFEPQRGDLGVCVWSGEVGSLVLTSVDALGVTHERVTIDGAPLLDRTPDSLTWRGAPSLALRSPASALALISDPAAAALTHALGMLYFFDSTEDHRAPVVVPSAKEYREFELQSVTFAQLSAQLKLWTLLSLNTSDPALGSLDSASLQRDYSSMFPFSDKLGVAIRSSPDERVALFHMRDALAPLADEIEQQDIASGMLRTLIYLVHLHTAPQGFVFIVDDFENSLGANCLGPMLEIFERHAARTQIVLTSHHPLVINNVREEHWRIVQRRGAVVSVLPAAQLPGILPATRQSPYTRLISSPAFDEGILPAEEQDVSPEPS